MVYVKIVKTDFKFEMEEQKLNFKKAFLTILLIIIVIISGIILFNSGYTKTQNSSKVQVVASNFASYDFLRAIIGDNENIQLTFLLGAGKDTHSYDPTAQDLITIQNADLFVYIGGETENWSERVLGSLDDKNGKIICIADYVETIEEQEIDGVEHEENNDEEDGAFDDHIWTSPSNAIAMINALKDAMIEIDSENKENYEENAKNYISEIEKVDSQIQEIVDNRVRDRLIFADKMPMQYFIDYYGLQVSAAFSGCSSDSDPSASTIAYLEDKVKEEEIPVVLYVELNNGMVANIIAEEAENGCEALQIQALHNVSLDDFNNGETWVSLMTKNIDVLRKALL